MKRWIDHNKDTLKLIRQFMKFGIVGISNTLINFIVYYPIIYIGLNYLLAHTLGFIISVLNAYYWNNKYVFQKNGNSIWKSLIKVFASYGLTFIVSTGTLFIMVHFLGVSNIIAPIINLVITVPVNFLLNKFWAFK
ncbi:GtrA family protein [Paenibacillus ferrarius]|uniref:GtrA family protein n=1 Tax=Paenibacillus ferrarius TaxID=1469647 RepID=UPI003D2B0EF0